jgi:hypothetical protein
VESAASICSLENFPVYTYIQTGAKPDIFNEYDIMWPFLLPKCAQYGDYDIIQGLC